MRLRRLLPAARASVIAAAICGGSAMAESASLESDTKAAFEAVRRGDTSSIGKLVSSGDAAVHAATPFVADSDPVVRREAIVLLAAIGTRDAAKAALPALADGSEEVRSRAAELVFRSVMRDGEDAVPGLAAALARDAPPQPNAARLLLAAFTPDNEWMLREAQSQTRLVKLTNAGPAVQASLPAVLALSRRGDREARSVLIERIRGAQASELEFLLQVLGIIDAPDVLHALAGRAFANETNISAGLPSGVEPRRRICDLAVDAFLARFRFDAGVAIDSTRRYSAGEIAKVRQALSARLPS
jgi:HEAT repeat protein